jgi:hypothetical protein
MLDMAGIANLDDARAASRDCPHCASEGFATIYHDAYDGKTPYNLENGCYFQTRKPAYCICPAGRWVMFAHQSKAKDVFQRVPDLHEFMDSRHGSHWSLEDPTIGYFDPSEVPDWKSLSRWIKSHGKPVIRKVYPESSGNRRAAYAEMGESVPGSVPLESGVPF